MNNIGIFNLVERNHWNSYLVEQYNVLQTIHFYTIYLITFIYHDILDRMTF